MKDIQKMTDQELRDKHNALLKDRQQFMVETNNTSLENEDTPEIKEGLNLQENENNIEEIKKEMRKRGILSAREG